MSISVSTQYPGASPENLYNSVTRLIEEELNGANGILNFESTSDSLGQVEITANFQPGTDTEMASVNVQNRIKRIESRLPRAVLQQGILVEEASSAVLQIITLSSTDGSLDEVGLGDFMIRNVLGEIRRIPGVGRATLYSTERALRIWIDPAKLIGYNLTAGGGRQAINHVYNVAARDGTVIGVVRRSAIIARTTSGSTGVPVPAAWLRISDACSAARRACASIHKRRGIRGRYPVPPTSAILPPGALPTSCAGIEALWPTEWASRAAC